MPRWRVGLNRTYCEFNFETDTDESGRRLSVQLLLVHLVSASMITTSSIRLEGLYQNARFEY